MSFDETDKASPLRDGGDKKVPSSSSRRYPARKEPMLKTTENSKMFRNTDDKEKAKNDEDEDSISSVDLSEEQDNLHELPDSRSSSP